MVEDACERREAATRYSRAIRNLPRRPLGRRSEDPPNSLGHLAESSQLRPRVAPNRPNSGQARPNLAQIGRMWGDSNFAELRRSAAPECGADAPWSISGHIGRTHPSVSHSTESAAKLESPLAMGGYAHAATTAAEWDMLGWFEPDIDQFGAFSSYLLATHWQWDDDGPSWRRNLRRTHDKGHTVHGRAVRPTEPCGNALRSGPST